MSDKDQFDEQAERLLPICFCDAEILAAHNNNHDEACPVFYRPAVAAALREQGKENQTLKTQRDWWRGHAQDYQEQIADLRAENERNSDALLLCQGELELALEAQGNLRAELKRTQTALGQAHADWMGCRDGALVRDLRAECDQLKAQLADLAPRMSG